MALEKTLSSFLEISQPRIKTRIPSRGRLGYTGKGRPRAWFLNRMVVQLRMGITTDEVERNVFKGQPNDTDVGKPTPAGSIHTHMIFYTRVAQPPSDSFQRNATHRTPRAVRRTGRLAHGNAVGNVDVEL